METKGKEINQTKRHLPVSNSYTIFCVFSRDPKNCFISSFSRSCLEKKTGREKFDKAEVQQMGRKRKD